VRRGQSLTTYRHFGWAQGIDDLQRALRVPCLCAATARLSSTAADLNAKHSRNTASRSPSDAVADAFAVAGSAGRPRRRTRAASSIASSRFAGPSVVATGHRRGPVPAELAQLRNMPRSGLARARALRASGNARPYAPTDAEDQAKEVSASQPRSARPGTRTRAAETIIAAIRFREYSLKQPARPNVKDIR